MHEFFADPIHRFALLALLFFIAVCMAALWKGFRARQTSLNETDEYENTELEEWIGWESYRPSTALTNE